MLPKGQAVDKAPTAAAARDDAEREEGDAREHERERPSVGLRSHAGHDVLDERARMRQM